MIKLSNGAPVLESSIARAGIIGVAVLSAYVGFHFWSSRGEEVLAWLTLGREAIALGGMGMVLHHGRRRWKRALGGLVVTALAAGWCAMTMVEKLTEEAHERAVSAAIVSPVYVQAKSDLEFASRLYRAALEEKVADGLGPQTTNAKSAEIAQRVAALKAERDRRKRVWTSSPRNLASICSPSRGAPGSRSRS